MLAGGDHLQLDADLIEKALEVDQVPDDAYAPRQRARLGNDPVGLRGDVVAARSGGVSHRDDYRLGEAVEEGGDLLGGGHRTPAGVEAYDDRLDAPRLLRRPEPFADERRAYAAARREARPALLDGPGEPEDVDDVAPSEAAGIGGRYEGGCRHGQDDHRQGDQGDYLLHGRPPIRPGEGRFADVELVHHTGAIDARACRALLLKCRGHSRHM